MKRFNLRVLFLLALVLFPLISWAEDTVHTIPIGTWQGEWSNTGGYVYVAEMVLHGPRDGKIGKVEGYINWILRKSPRAEEQSKIGSAGTEYVRGTYDPVNRLLSLDGYDKTDPNNILGLDKYRLVFAENGKVLGGITWNNGNWQGKIFLMRALK